MYTGKETAGFVYSHTGEEVAVIGARSNSIYYDHAISIYCGYGYISVKGVCADCLSVESHGCVIGHRKGKGGLTYSVDPSAGTSGVNGAAGGGPNTVIGVVSVTK